MDISNFNVENDENVILNLDIDIFFKNIEADPVQIFTDDFINSIADWVVEEKNNFLKLSFV